MPKFDLLVRNARLIDGSGAPSRAGDVAVRDGRIAAVGGVLAGDASTELDARGRALSPGFIDAHTHDDRAVLVDPAMTCKVSQGVTTVVTGNCGISIAPVTLDRRPPGPLDLICPEPGQFFAEFAGYFAALDRAPPAVNVVAQVGHTSLRVMACSDLARPATATETTHMKDALSLALRQGAAGLSTGLYYPPANAAPTEEVEALAAVLREHGAFHSTHMRDEGAGVLDSLAETFRIGRSSGVPVVISHHKCAGAPNHGRSIATLAAIEAARKDQPVGLDAYPYVASSTILRKEWAAVASRTLVTWSHVRTGVAGRDIVEIAAEMGLSIDDAIAALQPAGAVYFSMSEDDVRRILAFSATMIGSDGLPHDAHPHPRLWGTFPRVLGHYARDIGLFPLEEAVRKMTALTAETFGLADRGRIGEGCFADLVLFEPERIIDMATFDKPATPAAGIDLVVVNGQPVWRDGAATGARPGRALVRMPGRAAA